MGNYVYSTHPPLVVTCNYYVSSRLKYTGSISCSMVLLVIYLFVCGRVFSFYIAQASLRLNIHPKATLTF